MARKRKTRIEELVVPQQNRHICGTICICQMTAILSSVAIVYLSVAVYFPSMRAFYSGIVEQPFMCSTSKVVNVDKCNWGSCGEWCLSKTSGACLQIYVNLRHNGTTLEFQVICTLLFIVLVDAVPKPKAAALPKPVAKPVAGPKPIARPAPAPKPAPKAAPHPKAFAKPSPYAKPIPLAKPGARPSPKAKAAPGPKAKPQFFDYFSPGQIYPNYFYNHPPFALSPYPNPFLTNSYLANLFANGKKNGTSSGNETTNGSGLNAKNEFETLPSNGTSSSSNSSLDQEKILAEFKANLIAPGGFAGLNFVNPFANAQIAKIENDVICFKTGVNASAAQKLALINPYPISALNTLFGAEVAPRFEVQFAPTAGDFGFGGFPAPTPFAPGYGAGVPNEYGPGVPNVYSGFGGPAIGAGFGAFGGVGPNYAFNPYDAFGTIPYGPTPTFGGIPAAIPPTFGGVPSSPPQGGTGFRPIPEPDAGRIPNVGQQPNSGGQPGQSPGSGQFPSVGNFPSSGQFPSGGFPSNGQFPSAGFPSGGHSPDGGQQPSGGHSPDGGQQPSGGESSDGGSSRPDPGTEAERPSEGSSEKPEERFDETSSSESSSESSSTEASS